MRVLLPFSKGEVSESFYTDFHAGLARALAELGHEALSFPFEDIEQSPSHERQALYRLLSERPCEAVFDICCWAQCLSHARVWDGSSGGEPVFDSLDMDYVGLLFDQPWFQPLPGVQASRLHVAVPDLDNFAQLEVVYPRLKPRGTVFAPPAIDARNDCLEEGARRDIDLLYIGNLHGEALERAWRGAPDAALCDDVADLALAEPGLPLHAALGRVSESRGLQPDALAAQAVLRRVEFFRRTRFRLDAVRAAAASGAAMQVVGRGWERADLPANAVLQPQADYRAMPALAARARLCLDASTYLRGANDRVFNYLLNGGVCLTNAGGFLSGVYGEEGGLFVYPMGEPQSLAEVIPGLLANPRRLREQSQRGRELTLATQTWRHRVQAMLEMLAAPAGQG